MKLYYSNNCPLNLNEMFLVATIFYSGKLKLMT